jgi:hypothetical protein
MKRVLVIGLSLVCASAAFADRSSGPVVHWNRIAGVITALNVDNPVADIHSGTFAWSARSGHARVNLTTGDFVFDVEGLVINGNSFSGTPGPVDSVTGTLVCNPLDPDGHPTGAPEVVLDTDVVPLSAQGDAHSSGNIGTVPATCGNPLFLLRIATPATQAVGRWIATGAVRSFSSR